MALTIFSRKAPGFFDRPAINEYLPIIDEKNRSLYQTF
jgi:hypothetical protein